jgi:hypothetical protein
MAVSISGAKREETRKRRLSKVMQVLKAAAKWTGLFQFPTLNFKIPTLTAKNAVRMGHPRYFDPQNI